MKQFALLSLLVLAASCESLDYATRKRSDPAVSQAQFEQIKSLAGEWSGLGGDAHEGESVEVRYRVTAAGSAVEETLFPGTEHEMITMYHRNFDSLMLTHYCAAGNQPRMMARSDTESGGSNVIHFSYCGATNITAKDQGHMHDLEIRFVDPDHVQTDWTYFRDNKPAEKAHFDLTRKSSNGSATTIRT